MWTDRSEAIMKALDKHLIEFDTSIPGVPRTNGVAERQVQEVIYGTRVLLCMAGLPACFWPFAMCFYCDARDMRSYKGQVRR